MRENGVGVLETTSAEAERLPVEGGLRVVVADDFDNGVRTRLGVARTTLDIHFRVLIIDAPVAGAGDVLAVDLHELHLSGAQVQADRATERSAGEAHAARDARRDRVGTDIDLAADDVPGVDLGGAVGRGVVRPRGVQLAVVRTDGGVRCAGHIRLGIARNPDSTAGTVGCQGWRNGCVLTGAVNDSASRTDHSTVRQRYEGVCVGSTGGKKSDRNG